MDLLHCIELMVCSRRGNSIHQVISSILDTDQRAAPTVLTKHLVTARSCMAGQHNGRGFGGVTDLATTGRMDNPVSVEPDEFPSVVGEDD